MQIIIISPNSMIHKHWHFTRNKLIVACLVFIAILSSSALWFYQNINGVKTPIVEHTSLLSGVKTADGVGNELANNKTAIPSDDMQAYYAQRLGILQAEAIRLKALMAKLAGMAGLDTVPYSLNSEPAQGGIDDSGLTIDRKEFDDKLLELGSVFKQQSLQLSMIQDYLITEDSIESAIPMGKPIKGGWISSYYGYRLDPFNGKKTFHHGLDITGKLGSNIDAVADGIVSWTGKQNGYGQIVEIEHGNGYITRYAHNKSLTVTKGDRVKKGQQIALMGSTGRSTGPHVHFEVLLDGKTVNPYQFVK